MSVRPAMLRLLAAFQVMFLSAAVFATDKPSVAAAGRNIPAVAIIIDDLGNQRVPGKRVITLPGPVACAFLPDGPHTRALADLAHAHHKEVILHLPMQPQGQHQNPVDDAKRKQAGELTLEMTRREFMTTIAAGLAAIPHVSGVNNHQGSLLTRHPGNMAWLMQAIRKQGSLFFIDSRTTRATVAQRLADEYGVPASSRNVFLDNNPNPAAIRKQVKRLLATARREGTALAIGHPYPGTLAVLAEEIPRFKQQGIILLSVSELIERQQSRRLASWQESLSR